MTDNYKGAYSIKTLVDKNIKLNIPIYQRLFVWEEEQINLLLNDLYNSFCTSNDAYYIGIITIVENNGKWDIVDGQQRLTFLSLFGAVCLFSGTQNKQQWQDFLFIDDGKNDRNALRIDYMGRSEDREDLKKIANGNFADTQNCNFRIFLKCIEKFMKDKKENKENQDNFEEEWGKFTDYVYEKASFLVSELPARYAPADLNLFFEKMNSTGRQLTPVEQIKGIYFPGRSAEFDACLNFEEAFQEEEKGPNAEKTDQHSLLDILRSETQVNPEENGSKGNGQNPNKAGARSILSHEVFLLHCLEIAEKIQIERDERKILETFKEYVGENKEIKPNDLLETMKKYRKWLDADIIYLEASSDGSWEYWFRREDAEQGNKQNKDPEDKDLKSLKQFQSMLYVSSSNYQQWVLEAYRKRKNEEESPVQPQQLLKDLKEQDNARHSTKPEHMTYPNIDRYWFWKLDYLLWEKFTEKPEDFSLYGLTDEEKTAISNYKFRRNRSIEHLHPQTDGDNSDWTEDAKHRFGNLAMISSSFNSFQQNDSVGVKFARLQETQIPNGNLESIKLLLMFKLAGGKESEWTTSEAEDHGTALYKLLKSSRQTAETQAE